MNEFFEVAIWVISVAGGITLASYTWTETGNLLMAITYGSVVTIVVITVGLFVYFVIDSWISHK